MAREARTGRLHVYTEAEAGEKAQSISMGEEDISWYWNPKAALVHSESSAPHKAAEGRRLGEGPCHTKELTEHLFLAWGSRLDTALLGLLCRVRIMSWDSPEDS